ncbi:MAG: hypothetical protein KC646_17670 [Candidatus Cloacimonetes bacterium]|nr:hypothetical protein [Candidatus Cloacimonadota bacterium]
MKISKLLIVILAIIQIYSLLKMGKTTNIAKYIRDGKIPNKLTEYIKDREENPRKYENLPYSIIEKELSDQSCDGFNEFVPKMKQRVYFNDFRRKDNLEFYINRALDRVYCEEDPKISIAAYELSNSSLVEKISYLKKRIPKLKVNIVIEGDVISKSKQKQSVIEKLKSIGVSIKSDAKVRGNNLMHHKFIVINEKWLLTGSTNFSNRGVNMNGNNLVEIYSKKTCEVYLKEFDKLWSKTFSRAKKNSGKIMEVNKDTKVIMGPSNNINNSMFRLISSAKKSIEISMFSFSSSSTLTLLSVLKRSNRKIRLKLDNLTLGLKIQFNGQRKRLKDHLTNLKINFESDGSKSMYHHKYMIIDAYTANAMVLVGSMNYSDSGFYKNDENILIIKDKRIVEKFTKHFEYKYSEKVTTKLNPKKIRWPKFKSIEKNGDELKISVLNDLSEISIKLKDNKRWVKYHTDYGTKKEFVVRGIKRKHDLKLYSDSGVLFQQLVINTKNSVIQIPRKQCTYNYLKSNMWYDC